MNKRGQSFWDILAWIFLAGIVFWLFLKAMGVIHTPLWLEYSPIFGAVYIAGWAMQKLDRATEDIKEIKFDTKRVEDDIKLVKLNCPACKK